MCPSYRSKVLRGNSLVGAAHRIYRAAVCVGRLRFGDASRTQAQQMAQQFGQHKILSIEKRSKAAGKLSATGACVGSRRVSNNCSVLTLGIAVKAASISYESQYALFAAPG